MESTTKEKILDAALVSFSENGYQGTNLRELAAGMGLSKSALYKHYASKEEIRNAVLDRMEAYYDERFGSSENMPPIPESADELFAVTIRMLRFTMHDERVILMRRFLLTEQFRDERVKRLATLHFLTGTKDIFARLFAGMMEKGILGRGDPDMLALAFTAPITSLIHYCDREPDMEPEIMEQIEAYIRYFIEAHRNQSGDRKKGDNNHAEN